MCKKSCPGFFWFNFLLYIYRVIIKITTHKMEFTHKNFTTKNGKTLTLTVHAQERQVERDLLKLDLQAALDRAVTVNAQNVHKHPHLKATILNKLSSYDQNHIQVLVNPYFNVQFRVDSTNGNIVTVIKYK